MVSAPPQETISTYASGAEDQRPARIARATRHIGIWQVLLAKAQCWLVVGAVSA